MSESEPLSILPPKLSPETPVSLIIGGLQYDGTFLDAHDSVIRVRDPFEDNYIATQAVKASTIGKSKCTREKQRIELGSAVSTFRKILKALLNTPILLQFGSTILSGTVIKVSRRNVTLNTASSVTSGISATKIALAKIAVILVPLVTANQVRVGDPSFNISVVNNSLSVPAIAVFQEKP